MNTSSASRARSAGVAANPAPAASSGAARSGLRAWTRRVWPALHRFSAIGCPMAPSPIKPSVVMVDVQIIKTEGEWYLEWLLTSLAHPHYEEKPVLHLDASSSALPPHLSALEDDARLRIEEFFRHRHDWAGSSINYLAQRVIHEAYPELSAEEVTLLVGSIEWEHKIRADEEARMDEIITHYTNALY